MTCGVGAVSLGARWRPHVPWLVALAVGLCALLVRLWYVQHFAVSVPFWDQWDAEGDRLLKPWVEGTYTLPQLVKMHNEHRILPTRLSTLLLFELTGRWDNLVEARSNALLYATIPALLAFLAARTESVRWARWGAVATATLLAVLPFAWENFLVGFQSQFYFLVLASLLAAMLAAYRHDNIIAITAAVALSAVAALTMASGLLTPAVVACVYAIACYRLPGRRWPALSACIVLLAGAYAAYRTMPVIPEHGTLRAQSAYDFIDASSHVLGWPIVGYHWPIALLWLPGAVAVSAMLARRRGTRADVFFAGCYGWSLAQALAIAYGRGHGLLELTPRYSELLVPGLVANAWFALRLFQASPRRPLRAAAALLASGFGGALVGGLGLRTPGDWAAMVGRHDAAVLQQRNVARYLATRDPAALTVAPFEIPYPVAGRLQGLLDDPTILAMLPPSVTAPAPAGVPGPAGAAGSAERRHP